jgi:lipopolysaccharide export system permease protein
MIIYRKYIVKEIAVTSLAVLAILTLIYVSGRYVEYLGDAASGRLGKDMIVEMMSLKLISASVKLLPICVFLSVLLVLGRMKQSRELTTIYSSGLGRGFVMKSVGLTALLFAIVVFCVAFINAPWAEKRAADLEARANAEADINGIASGRFKELREGNRMVYVSELSQDRSLMRGIFMQYRQDDTLGLVKAHEATLETDEKDNRYIVLYDGSRYINEGDALDYRITDFETYSIRLDQQSEDPRNVISAVATRDLLARDDPLAVAELQSRLSHPLATIILALLGGAMSLGHGREARYLNLIAALLIFFIYQNMLAVARTMVKAGDLPGEVGLWWVHAALLAIILTLLFKDQTLASYKRRKSTMPRPD